MREYDLSNQIEHFLAIRLFIKSRVDKIIKKPNYHIMKVNFISISKIS
jgi:hypothetical protein